MIHAIKNVVTSTQAHVSLLPWSKKMQQRGNRNEPETSTDLDIWTVVSVLGEIAALSITMLILCEAEKLADIFQCPVAGGFGDSAYSGRAHLSVGS